MGPKETIIEYIQTTFIKGDESKHLTNDTSFLEEGIIDSVGVLELVAYLESAFDFRIEDEEIIPENLDSVNRLVAFIALKSAAPEASK